MRIEHARLQQCWKSCANGSNTLLRYASTITEQKKCWELLAEKFDRFQTCATTRNNMHQGVQTDATCNIQQCWELLADNVTSVCTGLNCTLQWLGVLQGSCESWETWKVMEFNCWSSAGKSGKIKLQISYCRSQDMDKVR